MLDTRAYFHSGHNDYMPCRQGLKVFSWLGTLWGGLIIVRTTTTFCLLDLILLFTIGGFTGIILANGRTRCCFTCIHTMLLLTFIMCYLCGAVFALVCWILLLVSCYNRTLY
jgi:heme/copper-type cytochrome/quinol oxidase subunit 1